jgi:hypothetical protein
MAQLIIVGAGMAVFFFLLWAIVLREQGQTFDMDVNEGIEPLIDGPIDVDALRREPSKLEELRGKIGSVVYYEGTSYNVGTIGESWVIDTNGATILMEKRQVKRDEDDDVDHAVSKTNLEIEQNARWLADALDVPFED